MIDNQKIQTMYRNAHHSQRETRECVKFAKEIAKDPSARKARNDVEPIAHHRIERLTFQNEVLHQRVFILVC